MSPAYLSRELNLTDSQRDQIASMWKEELPRMRGLLRELIGGLSEMPLADANGSFDEDEARGVADNQAAILSQLLVERQRVIERIYTHVLTPEQRQKADDLCQHMHDRGEGFLNGGEHPSD